MRRRGRRREHLLGKEATPRRLVLAALVKLSGVSQRQLGEGVNEKDLKWVAEFKGRPVGDLSLAEQADLPDWLTERLLAQMTPPELLALAQGLNQAAPLDLRVNPLKAGREAVLARFCGEGIAAEAEQCLATLYARLGEPADRAQAKDVQAVA